MSAVVPLPTALHTVTQQEIAAEHEQCVQALLMTGVMSNLRRRSADVQGDPDDAGKLARGLSALARWRDAERRWKQAEHICGIKRGALALEAAKAMGVCIECSATAKDGYCDECRENNEEAGVPF